AGEFAEAVEEDAGVIERGDGNEALLLCEFEVLFAATRRDMDDAGTFSLAHFTPGDNTMNLLRRHRRGPVKLAHDTNNFLRKARWFVLRRQLIERSVVLPADHVLAADFADDFVAAFFLEDLFERLELRDAVDPFLAFELFLKAVRGESPLGDVVDFVL